MSFAQTEARGAVLGGQLAEDTRPALWRNYAFIILFIGNTLTVLGNAFHSIALNLWVLQSTGSAKMMSAVLITYTVTSLLFGSLAGTAADRWDRRKLMLFSDLIRGVLVVLIAVCMIFPGSPFYLILLITALSSFVSLFKTPAFNASLISIVGRANISQASGAVSLADNIGRTVGFALGGVAVMTIGGVGAILIDALMFFIAAGLLLLVRFPKTRAQREAEAYGAADTNGAATMQAAMPAGAFGARDTSAAAQPEKESFKQSFINGLKFVREHPFAKAVTILNPLLIMFFVSSLMLIQVVAVQVWNATPFEFGLIEACIPIGYMLGAGIIMAVDKRLKKRGLLIMGGVMMIGPLYMLMALVSKASLAIPLILIVGFVFSFGTLLVTIIMRLTVAEELQGRVFGLLGSLTSVAPPVWLAVTSYFADIHGPERILLLNGLLFTLVSVMLFFYLKAMRKFD